jgi:hypothetical protein
MSEEANLPRNRAIAYISTCDDPEQLRKIARNAAAGKDWDVQRIARLRLYAVAPAEDPGTLAHAVWSSIFALEDALSDESGTTKRLSRTRQKIGRDGEKATVRDLVMGKPTEGFRMLIEREMIEYTFEAVALRFPEEFDEDVLQSARARLERARES